MRRATDEKEDQPSLLQKSLFVIPKKAIMTTRGAGIIGKDVASGNGIPSCRT